jgi:hypothetical protein
VAHQKHVGIDGVVWDGRNRRDCLLLVSETMSSMWLLWTAPARFLAQGGQVDDGGDDGVDGETRGCSSWWGEEMYSEARYRVSRDLRRKEGRRC